MIFLAKLLGVLIAIVVSLVGLLVAAVLVAIVFFDPNDWKAVVTDRATVALDREVTIDGPITLSWGWVPKITVEGLRIANTAWGEAPYLTKIARLDASIRLWPLLRSRVVVPEINVRAPELFLQQNAEAEVNWALGQRPNESTEIDPTEELAEQTLPDDRTEFPVVERLEIANGVFRFVDQTRDLVMEGAVDTIAGGGGGGERVTVSGEGELQGQTFEVRLDAGAFTKLRDQETPYPVELSIRLGRTEADISGTLTKPLELAGVDLNLSVSGQDLADTFPLTQIPLPPTPPYRLSGDLVREGQVWRFADLDGRLGDSDLRGTVEADLGQEPLAFGIDLISNKLDFDDLGGFIGAPTGEEEEPAGDGVIPDQEIDLTRLQAANGIARLRAKQILAPDLPIDDLDASFTLEDGVLTLEPAEFGVAKGTVNLWVSLYGAQDPVEIDALARISDLRLKEAFRGSEFVQEMGGQIDGRVELSGKGNSLRQMLDAADGTSYLVMSDGQISALILEAAGLDAMEALGLWFGDGGDAKVDIRCLATDLLVEQGVVKTKLAVLDTADTLIEVDGSIDLGQETLDLVMTPHPKDFSLLNLRSKVHVEDEFTDPSISLDAGSILKFVPPIDWGTQQDAPCDRLVKAAKEEGTL
ncbi:MAG: AsmA family protein [Geminicoccaceae bacterium]